MSAFAEVRLGDLAPESISIVRGFPTQRAQSEGGVRVMSIAALRNDAAPRHFADPEDLADVGIDKAQQGDVLVAIEGGTLGETMVVPEQLEPFVPSQQVATLRVLDPDRLDPWYLGAWLSTDPAGEQLRRLARGSGIQRIAMRDLAALSLSVPPLAVQKQIGARFQAFDTSIRLHRAITSCLEELRAVDLGVAFADLANGGGAT